MSHLMRKANGHLLRTSTGHLRLKHPGYAVSYSSTAQYVGTSSIDIEPEEETNSPLYSYFAARVSAAIAAMASGTTVSVPILTVGDLWGQSGMGWWHYISSAVKSIGMIYTVAANSGAPFGSPLADIDVTITGGTSPLVKVGTGSSAPTGNPKDWTGTSVTASGTLEDIELNAYLWFSVWCVPPGSYSSNPYDDSYTASISATNIRYRPS